MLPCSSLLGCVFILAWLVVFGSGCGGGGGGGGSSPAPSVTPPPVDDAPPASEDVVAFSRVSDAGLDRPYTAELAELDPRGIRFFSGGVAAADVDGNGYVDLLVVGGNLEPNHFYANEEGTFTEAGADLGLDLVNWASGPAFGGY